MFDIGFGEILICLVIALVVIGPEQLPGTVRTIGLWLGRLKRSLRETREEIERQIGADDIRRQLHNEDIMRSLEQTRQTMENSIMAGTQEAKPASKHYGPPEELPDHAHMDEPVKPIPGDSAQIESTGTATEPEPTSKAEQDKPPV